MHIVTRLLSCNEQHFVSKHKHTSGHCSASMRVKAQKYLKQSKNFLGSTGSRYTLQFTVARQCSICRGSEKMTVKGGRTSSCKVLSSQGQCQRLPGNQPCLIFTLLCNIPLTPPPLLLLLKPKTIYTHHEIFKTHNPLNFCSTLPS